MAMVITVTVAIFLMFFPSVAIKSRKTEKGQPKGCKIKEKGSH
jgi:hypothetical protein